MIFYEFAFVGNFPENFAFSPTISSPSCLNYSEYLIAGLYLSFFPRIWALECSEIKFLIHLRPFCRCTMQFQQCKKQEMTSSVRLQHYDVTSCKQRHLIVKHNCCKGVSILYKHRKFWTVSVINEGVIAFSKKVHVFLRHPVEDQVHGCFYSLNI